MYKLTVVSGPNTGTTYSLHEGENSLGRVEGNVIVLPSSNISKRHCTLRLVHNNLTLEDQGSTNGTFVNGSLTKKKELHSGDRISVGDYILQVVNEEGALSPLVSGNVIPFPDLKSSPSEENVSKRSVPSDLKGKIQFYLEHYLMPPFYSLLFKHQWKFVVAALFTGFVVVTMFASIYPLLKANEQTVIRESGRRAQLIAREISEKNAPLLASQAESSVELGSLAKGEGIKVAALVDLSNRVLAPTSRAGKYLTQGDEATFAVKAAKIYQSGREGGFISKINSSTVAAIEPVKVINPRIGQNVVVAMAIVSIDTSLATPSWSTVGLIYSEAFIVVSLLGIFLLYVLYRMTLKPLEVLNEDLDQVLRGQNHHVTQEFHWEETAPLWNNINAALQRIPRDGSGGVQDPGGFSAVQPEVSDFIPSIQALGDLASYGVMVCDEEKKVLYINPYFEEVAGFRNQDSLNRPVSAVARDQAFVALVEDLFQQIQSGSQKASEDFEFSGIAYKIYGAPVGVGNGKGLVLTAKRSEE